MKAVLRSFRLSHHALWMKPMSLLVIVSLLLFGTAATSTSAAPAPGPSAKCQYHSRGGCTPSCHYEQRGPYTWRVYDRGYAAGEDDGWYEGYDDGKYGRRYCNQPRYRIRRSSRHYVAGYYDGFADAYAEGYEKGRRRSHRRHRSNCPCCR